MNYRCSNCSSEHGVEAWNSNTATRLGVNSAPAPLPMYFKDDDSLFFCPSCQGKVYGDELSVVKEGKTDDPVELRVGRSKR